MLSAISRTVLELSVFRRFTGTYIFSIANLWVLSIFTDPTFAAAERCPLAEGEFASSLSFNGSKLTAPPPFSDQGSS
jgi:hypothetical protein